VGGAPNVREASGGASMAKGARGVSGVQESIARSETKVERLVPQLSFEYVTDM
jgi:hypothetical protein